ncbi:MAG: hypothetical protein D6720_02380 [Gammaproteobacteria bacterium]|nr:MAG: hypothetical protein D6720_02380 [Gammaproteobacteria bacterium]
MNPLEGKIHIELAGVDDGRTRIDNQRALGASALLRGKRVAQALEVVPLLFNVCGMAQARAACRAAESALNQAATPSVEQARELLVLMEWAREHLARILIDWPRLFGEPPDIRALPAIGTLLAQLRTRLFPHNRAFALNATAGPIPTDIPEVTRLEQILEDEIFHMPARRWAEMGNIEALLDWSDEAPGIAARSIRRICEAGWSSQGRCDVSALPPIPLAEIQDVLAGDTANDFVRRPTWTSRARETTSFTRQRHHPLVATLEAEFGNGLLTRWVARLVELAELPAAMRRIAAEPPEGSSIARCEESQGAIGVAQTEAARGRLYHFIEIENDRIGDYRILAPTEWNFHPEGVVAAALDNLSLPDPEERRFVAELLVNAIDPCVASEVVSSDA